MNPFEPQREVGVDAQIVNFSLGQFNGSSIRRELT